MNKLGMSLINVLFSTNNVHVILGKKLRGFSSVQGDAREIGKTCYCPIVSYRQNRPFFFSLAKS